jgi:hypothetical protein
MHLESEIAAGCYWQAQQWARGVVAGA